jgi:methylated-DNA-[protein]-cysteine S-methyltransferase
MKLYYDTFPTPMGEFAVAVNETGAVVATTFFGGRDLKGRLPGDELVRDAEAASAAREELEEFFKGERRQFSVKIAPRGTDFQKQVWSALRRIPFGETRSYGQLAAEVGNAKASRAVGRANGANPVCPIVPCHRCIGADGSLTGFGFGEKLKKRLLDHEQSAVAKAN